MKKTTYTVEAHSFDGENMSFQGDMGNAAHDQLIAHKDIDVIDLENHTGIIIPYHAIDYAVFLRSSETVSAPTDANCGGEGSLMVTIGDDPYLGFASCEQTASGVGQYYLFPMSYVSSVSLNGTEVPLETFTANAVPSTPSGTYDAEEDLLIVPVGDCEDHLGETKSFDITYTYEGESVTITVTGVLQEGD